MYSTLAEVSRSVQTWRTAGVEGGDGQGGVKTSEGFAFFAPGKRSLFFDACGSVQCRDQFRLESDIGHVYVEIKYMIGLT